ncbi:hypothetical protein HDU96_005696 [Phlyctochytrium bullatum]|nr:hypothetical protein HDU96_005696 [Phlyctochytrium bullatum]
MFDRYCRRGLLILHFPNAPAPLSSHSVSLRASVAIVHSGARVTISQTFHPAAPSQTQDSKPFKASEALYQFPLPENAAVCAFECDVDGKRIAGIVKEKEEAREEYKAAVESGKTAGLVEQQQPDVFQISLGNIQGSKVTTHITYIQELAHDADAEEFRFTLLSKQLTRRYGDAPTAEKLPGTVGTSVTTNVARMNLDDDDAPPAVSISLEMATPIVSVRSPSHASMVVSLGAAKAGGDDAFDPCKALIELEDEKALDDEELVVVAKVKGMNEPVCMVERHPLDGTHCVGVTMVPRFALNEIRSELVVLVDRSGSMAGGKIMQAALALEVFLKSIPPGSYFNIVGFGSHHQNLFPKSKEYSAATLKTASDHVANLKADLGGTEIQRALEAVFASRRTDMPTQVFVLTDGEVWNVESLIESVKSTVAKSEKEGKGKAFVRVFALGIGGSVSHHLVEGIARAGGGFAEFVGEQEKLKAKVIKMLKASVMPPLTNYKIDWTEGWKAPEKQNGEKDEDDDFEMVEANGSEKKEKVKKKPSILSFFSASSKPAPPPAADVPKSARMVQQAPYIIPNIWPGVRFNAYAILDPSVPVPKTLTITADSTDGPISISLPVRPAPAGQTLHALAARKLIQDLEEERSFLADAFTGPMPAGIAKKEMVRLGTHYCLASKHTSFLAVDHESGKDVVSKPYREAANPVPVQEMMSAQSSMMPMARMRRASPQAFSNVGGGFGARASAAPTMFTSTSSAAPALGGGGFGAQAYFYACAAPAPGGVVECSVAPPPAPMSAAPAPAFSSFGNFQVQQQQQQSQYAPVDELITRGESLQEKKALELSDSSHKFAKTKKSISMNFSMPFAALAPKGRPSAPNRSVIAPAAGPAFGAADVAPTTPDDILAALTRLQAFDGSFQLEGVAALCKVDDAARERMIEKLKAVAGGVEVQSLELVLACALAIALMEGALRALKEEWEMMEGKARRVAVAAAGESVWVEARTIAGSEIRV